MRGALWRVLCVKRRGCSSQAAVKEAAVREASDMVLRGIAVAPGEQMEVAGIYQS